MSKTGRRAAKRALKQAAQGGGVAKAASDGKPKPKSAAFQAAKEAVRHHFLRNSWPAALHSLQSMRDGGHTPDTTLVNQVLTVACRSKQCTQALALLQQMRGKEPGPAYGVKPSAVSYAIVVKFTAAAGEVDTALTVVDFMRADGVPLDAVALNSAITACRGESVARLPDARAFFQEAQAAGLADVHTYNALLGVYKSGAMWQEAQQLLEDMLAGNNSAPAPDAVSFTSAIAACGTARQPDAARQLFLKMAPREVQACNACITAFERAGRWQDALELLADMEQAGPQPDEITLRAAVFACCAAVPGPPRLEEAMSLFRRCQAGEFAGVRRNALTTNLLVRACDVAGNGSEATRLLAGILASHSDEGVLQAATCADTVVLRHAEWSPSPVTQGPAAVSGGIVAVQPYTGSVRVVHHEPGHQRRPRNLYDLRIFATTPGAVRFCDDTLVVPHVTSASVPHVPGAFVLSGVLTRQECAQLIACSEAMGFTKDAPVVRQSATASATAGNVSAGNAQVGIDNCCWLADDSLMKHLWARVHLLLPQVFHGCALAGINARWRLFRYAPGAVYRPHVDGAWPGSGLSKDGQYLYDFFKDGRRSKLTFLVYLNDDIAGGHTVFYTPSTSSPGALDARGVSPTSGCVLCFPHGDTPGSLVHEGSAVHTGVKYVIRTEVLYSSKREEDAKDA